MRHLAKALIASILASIALSSVALAANGDCRLIRGASTTTDTTDDVSVCRQDTWFHQAAAKVGNAAGFGADAFPSWNNTKPTAAMSSGAGGAYVTNSAFHQGVGAQDPRGSAVFQGTYTGVLDNLAVDLYAAVAPIFSNELNIELRIDGEAIYASSAEVTAQSGENTVRLKFAFTNLYNALEAVELQGDATTVHNVRLAVNGVYAINDPAVFLYDASDAASGISFNLDAGLNGYTKLDTFAS